MTADLYPLQVLLVTLAGWVNRHQQHVIEYLVEENRSSSPSTRQMPTRTWSSGGGPTVLWGTGAPTLPRPGLGRQMGGSGAWFALEPVGRPHRRLRRVRTHG